MSVSESWMQQSHDWHDFYVIVGGSAAGLTVLAAAAGIWMRTRFALETAGATMILLLVIGIRNAWDLVLWMAKQTES